MRRNSVEDILEFRTPRQRPGGLTRQNDTPGAKFVFSATNGSATSTPPNNPYENLQAPPKPSFIYSPRLHLLTAGYQESAPPKPALDTPKTNQLESLIYSTLKELRPNAQNTKKASSPTLQEIHPPSHTPKPKFTVTPVASPGMTTPTKAGDSCSYRESFDNGDVELGDDDLIPPKRDGSPEPVKYITVPEDLANLDRRSILRARFKKSMEYAKRALGFIISHIGLSLMVVGYTILGALVFCAVERERERQVKANMLKLFNNTLNELMDVWNRNYFYLRETVDLIHRATLVNRTNHSGKQGLEGLDWYLHGLELSKEVIPRHWIEGIVSGNSSTTFRNLMNSTSATTTTTTTVTPVLGATSFQNRTYKPETMEFDYKEIMNALFNNTSNSAQMFNLTLLVDSVRENVTRIMASYVNQVVHAIKDEGWNGALNIDDINWTFEGGVLFAITVITTIASKTDSSSCYRGRSFRTTTYGA